tara:strand:+ start:1261 stop:2025 length:765 start_codon:yes stop_codon:yes gene_type:complete
MENTNLKLPNFKILMPLVFHRIVEDQIDDWEDVNTKNFNRVLDLIGENHAVFRPNNRIDGHGWCITFDDGNVSDYEVAYPILKSRNIKATFFLIVSKIGKKGYLDWSQVNEMYRNGMSFGSHGLNHLSMNKLTPKEAFDEFKQSKDILEDGIGDHISAFSYPFGEYNAETHKIGKTAGYNFLLTSDHGIKKNTASIFPRNNIHSGMSPDNISKVLNPNIYLRGKWVIEDGAKKFIKRIIGRGNYIKIRTRIIHD